MKTNQKGFDIIIPVYNEGINIVKLIKYLTSLNQTIMKSNILILATPHKVYKKIKTKKPIIDIWNFIKK